MRWIYISPHLDDAVLSCGGLIWEQAQAGIPVEIWTVVCGVPSHAELSPFAQKLHTEWGTDSPAQTVSLRRAEDQEAAHIVGAKTVYFDVPDCIYRRSAAGEWLYDDIFVPPHPAEADLPESVAQTLSAHLAPDDILVCPLTVGRHVDHVMVRQAVEALGRPLRYYADIPYLLKKWPSLFAFVDGYRAEAHPVSEQGLLAWQDGIAAYASQISSLFPSVDAMRDQIRAYWQGAAGLTLWKKAE